LIGLSKDKRGGVKPRGGAKESKRKGREIYWCFGKKETMIFGGATKRLRKKKRRVESGGFLVTSTLASRGNEIRTQRKKNLNHRGRDSLEIERHSKCERRGGRGGGKGKTQKEQQQKINDHARKKKPEAGKKGEKSN